MSEASHSTDFDLDLALEGSAIRRDTSEIECLIKSLGQQMEVAKESISKEWQSLVKETQLSPETNITSLKGISQFFQEQVQQEKQSCTAETINLNVFLNNVVQALERNVGQEENILDELISFSVDHGFILPAPQLVSNEDVRSSTASLNVVINKDEENTNALWDKIRTMISRGLLASIDRLGTKQDKSIDKVLLAKKVKLLEKLCVLYPPSGVWRKYIGMRSQQIERLLQNPVNFSDSQAVDDSQSEENIPGEAVSLVKISYILGAMFCEDYSILELGMFPDAFQMQPEEIFNAYLSRFNEELREVVKQLYTLGRRGSGKLADSSGGILPQKIFSALRQCVLAASTVESSAKKFLHSLQFSYGKRGTLETIDSRFGSTSSIPGTPEAFNISITEGPFLDNVVRDQPEETQEDMWCWQEEFKLVVSKLALAIAENIQLAAQTALEKEMEEYEQDNKYEAVKLVDGPASDSLDHPKQVAKSCFLIFQKTDEILPFLLLRPGKEFDSVRTSFIESLATVLTTYHSRLVRMSSDVPKCSTIKNLYLAFNTAIFIQHTLKCYEDEYGEITSSFSTVYSELVDSLSEKITNYHFSTIATVILQDVQSQHWMNQKEFFEGERCSFSVQMWNYYMQGVQHDLWQLCPPRRAQAIFTSILQHSLSCFVRRYSKAIPSYKRTKLFRSDITSLLLSISSWMIFVISTSSTDIFNPDPTSNAVTEIHNSCSALLAIMTVISCPLETLCLFTSGGGEELISDGKSIGTSWLSWLQPELFGEHTKSLLSLSDIQAVNIYFKLMIHQPRPIWELVLQTVLSRNAYLAVTMVTYLESHFIHLHHEDDSDITSKKPRVQFRDRCVGTSNDKSEDDCHRIVGSLYYIILKCCKRSKPMVNFIIALMNRENSWQVFTSVEGLRLGDEDKIPVWLDCLYSTFKPFIRRLTQLAVSRLCHQQPTNSRSFKFTSISSLPCGCQLTKETPGGKPKDKAELFLTAFQLVLKNLASSLRLIPKILLKVFNRIEGDLRQLKLTSDDAPSAGQKILGSMLFRSFCTTGPEDIPEGLYCDDDFSKDCVQLGQLIYHVMVGEMKGFIENAGWPVALETLITNKKEWIADQMRRISDFISEMDGSESFMESGQDHFLELQFRQKVEELFLESKGEKALKQVYRFCQARKDWVLRRIPLVSHLGSLQQSQTKVPSDTFDPLHAYSSLGGYPFDHNAIEDFPFDWEQMLQSNIGMSLRSFKRLVYNRYELQNEKDVEEDKKGLVEKLKDFYDCESEIV